MPALGADEIMTLLAAGFPKGDVKGFRILRHDAEHLVLRQAIEAIHMRPGDTVSGPAIMALADTATWLLILGSLGPLVQAVTTSLSIHFLRRPRGPARPWPSRRPPGGRRRRWPPWPPPSVGLLRCRV